MKAIKLFSIAMLLAIQSWAQTNFQSLNYLYSIRGTRTIGGMHNRQPNASPNTYSQQLNNITGVWPGLYSADFQFEPNEIANRQTMINQAINEWNNGAMINLMWHACNPAKNRPCYWDGNGVLSTMTDWEWNQLITNGTAINNNWKAMMDEVAYYLQQLEDAGVEVFFRPLHEMNQGMFWWGGRPGANGTRRLYQITRDYFTNVKGLTNLIWVWNLQDYASLANDLNNYDPGWDYWDVLTLDMYWTDGQGYTTAKYNAMVNKAAGRPIGIGECEDLPAVNLLNQQPLWTFFMGWSELTFQANSNQKIQEIYWSDRVITLNEMPGWNQPPPATYYAIPGTVQAEAYSNMSGVQTENTSDTGGGQNVGYIDAGDWMTYNVNVASAGSYTVSYRVASQSGGGSIRLEQAGGGTVYGTISVPSTGGWQTWTTISHTVTLPAGQRQIGLVAPSGGFNLNWIGFAPASSTQYIQAEAYSNMSGVQVENTSDTGGGQNVGWIDAGDWMSYNNINVPTSGTYTIAYRVASQSGGGNIQLEGGGGSPVYGTRTVAATGGWQTWTTIYHNVSLTAGTQNFGIKALSGGFNLNWWALIPPGGSRLSNEAELAADLAVTKSEAYPNPFRDQVIFTIPAGDEGYIVKVFDPSGRLVHALTGKGNECVWKVTESDMLEPGLYLYRIEAGGRVTHGKLIRAEE